MSTFLAVAVRPFLQLLIWGCIVLPICWYLDRKLPDGRLKRILFKRIY